MWSSWVIVNVLSTDVSMFCPLHSITHNFSVCPSICCSLSFALFSLLSFLSFYLSPCILSVSVLLTFSTSFTLSLALSLSLSLSRSPFLYFYFLYYSSDCHYQSSAWPLFFFSFCLSVSPLPNHTLTYDHLNWKSQIYMKSQIAQQNEDVIWGTQK